MHYLSLLPRALLLATIAAFTSGQGAASQIVFGNLGATLDTGSLAGATFPVSFSYDASLIDPAGDSYVSLSSFDFTLRGTAFSRKDIFQGGQVMFHNGVLENVTASFQVLLPPNPPVENITFGFGGPGIIGYIDLAGRYGSGSFRFIPASVPEPGTLALACLALGGLLLANLHKKARHAGVTVAAPKRQI